MMTIKAMPTTETNDAELVAASLGGNREAFRGIVERYQTLICSLAYCATGNVSQSQDMAQETFLAAWKDLAGLREPEKLRAWLCRIVRNRIYKSHRQSGRDPVADAAPLEEGHEVASRQALPCEQTISREEEAILWRSLERVPETYREPLILFYREHQSIEHVAAALELSEDAVKQRLARGRKLLQEEVQAFVENTLVRTAPGQGFCNGVLAALPLTGGSMATATASLGAKGAATAKSGFLTLWLLPLAPFIGIFAGFLAQFHQVWATTAGRLRWVKTAKLTAFWILMPGGAWAGETAVMTLRQHFAWAGGTFFVARTGFWFFYALLLATWLGLMYHRVAAAFRAAGATGVHTPAPAARPMTPAGMLLNSAGIHLSMFLWVIYLAWRSGDALTAGSVAVLAVLLAARQFSLQRRQGGRFSIRSTFGHVTFCCALIVLVINLRLDVWMANNLEISVAEIHQRYPMWLVPLFTVVLGLWVALLVLPPGRRQPGGPA